MRGIGEFNPIFFVISDVQPNECDICGQKFQQLDAASAHVLVLFLLNDEASALHHPCYFQCFSRMSATSAVRNSRVAAALRGIFAFFSLFIQ
jgi:hypothetical protein